MEPRPVLVLNAGSSSLKYQAVEPGSGTVHVKGAVERLDASDLGAALETVSGDMRDAGLAAGDLLAVGHRVVHGGRDFSEPTLLDDDVVGRIEALSVLAPLHNPPAVAGIRSARAAYPDLPQVAVFDTAFFHDLPEAAATYAIDAAVARKHSIRRYGFHGTSHAYVSGAAADLLGRTGDPNFRVVVLHLGNGASASAVRGGRAVDVSMGITPLEGLVMGTRPGDLDPGILLLLMRKAGLGADDLEDLLSRRSGLKGLSGHGDVRDVLAAADAGDRAAALAWEVYTRRIRKYVGAYFAVLGGADAVVFTAGVGEHSARARADVLTGLDVLGIVLDTERNQSVDPGARRVSTEASPVAVLVVPTNEELSIARQTAALVR